MDGTKSNITPPNEDNAKKIVQDALGKNVKEIHTFATSSANFVYEVETVDGERLMLKLARPDVKHFFDAALFWYKELSEKNLPVPKLYYSDIKGRHGFPVLIMERLPGEDLGVIYPELGSEDKKILAERIVTIHKTVASTLKGSGYGKARSFDDPSLYETWKEFLNAHLEASRERIRNAGLVDEEVVDKAREFVNHLQGYFATVKPVCFLAGMSTRNVIIHQKRLSGVTSIHNIGFGDPLLPIGLTKIRLLAKGYDTEYTDYWAEGLGLSYDQRLAIQTYTLMYCVKLLSKINVHEQPSQPDDFDEHNIEHLQSIFDSLTKS